MIIILNTILRVLCRITVRLQLGYIIFSYKDTNIGEIYYLNYNSHNNVYCMIKQNHSLSFLKKLHSRTLSTATNKRPVKKQYKIESVLDRG